MRFVYLHGFASSPGSIKARFFHQRFEERGVTLEVPDLNAPSFRELSLTRNLATLAGLVHRGETAVLLGSSLGGYTAALFATLHPDRVAALVLMAPALNMAGLLRERHGEAALARWRESGSVPVEHPAYPVAQPLDYGFQTDAERWESTELLLRCPTLILHGADDPEVPIAGSEALAARCPAVRLVPLPSGHTLTDVMDRLWAETEAFLGPWLPGQRLPGAS